MARTRFCWACFFKSSLDSIPEMQMCAYASDKPQSLRVRVIVTAYLYTHTCKLADLWARRARACNIVLKSVHQKLLHLRDSGGLGGRQDRRLLCGHLPSPSRRSFLTDVCLILLRHGRIVQRILERVLAQLLGSQSLHTIPVPVVFGVVPSIRVFHANTSQRPPDSEQTRGDWSAISPFLGGGGKGVAVRDEFARGRECSL